MKFYLFCSLVLFSCSSTQKKYKVFDDVQQNNEKTELYFFHYDPLIQAFENHIKKPIVQEFRISDPIVINQILHNWMFPSLEGGAGLFTYHIELAHNQELISSVSLNDDLSIVRSKSQALRFVSDSLLKYQGYFIPIKPIVIEIQNRDNAISFIELAKEHRGYFPFHNSESQTYDFEKFKGQITLEYPIDLIPDSVEDIFDFVAHQLPFESILKNGQMSSGTKDISYLDDQINIENLNEVSEDQKVIVTLYCRKPGRIPEDFKILSSWDKVKDIRISVYNLSVEKLLAIANENSIEIKIIHTTANNG